MRLSLSEIAAIIGSSAPREDPVVTGIVVDSREAKTGDLFCAVKGKSADGHEFICDAARAGAVAGLVTEDIVSPLPTLHTRSIADALAAIGSHIRDSFSGPVIGITGSVGKTAVKELLAAGLSSVGPVVKSEGNLNTEYGLPMTWMKLEPLHRFAVLEMAMRARGQIAQLCSFCRPTAGVITTIGTAHIGELGGRQAILEAKMELLDALPAEGFAALPADCASLAAMKARTRCRIITFGVGENADVCAGCWETDVPANRTKAEFRFGNERVRFAVPGLGRHQTVNAAAALAACAALDVDLRAAAEAMEGASTGADRLRAFEYNGATVLVDVYNSSAESCIQALQVLAMSPGSGRRVAILGDMLEQGEFAEESHRAVGAEAAGLNLDRLALIGRSSHWVRAEAIERGFTGRIDTLGSIEDAADILRKLEAGDVALIKGSRALELERALDLAGVSRG